MVIFLIVIYLIVNQGSKFVVLLWDLINKLAIFSLPLKGGAPR